MIAQLELQTYNRIVGYLSGNLSLSNFREWFDSNTWEHTGDSDLLGQIELYLAEFSSGHRSEPEFKEMLHSYLPDLTLHLDPFSEARETVVTSANNALRMLRGPISRTLGSPVGLLREVESV